MSTPETAGDSAPESAPDGDDESFLLAVFHDRIWTIPNLLSVGRLLCIPLFLWLLFGLDDPLWASLLLAVLGATDWLDGYLARRLGQVSEMGKLLDPAADRILLITAVIAITAYGAVPLWFAVPVMVREPLMFAAVVVLGMLGAKRIDVTWFGKAGTFALMFAFPLFLLGEADFAGAEVATVLGWACGIPGLALSYYATLQYLPMAKRAFAERHDTHAP